MKRLSPLLAAFFVACATQPDVPRPAPAAVPEAAIRATTGGARRVVLVSFDGLSADELTRFETPTFDSLPVRVTRVIPVTPSATSATHAAILTGHGPERTGIVSNQFYRRGTPREETTRGLMTEIETDTIVDRARKAGKRTGCILFPFTDALSARRTCDFGLAWTNNVAPSRIVHLQASDFRSEWVPPSWSTPQPRHPSFSPVRRARLTWEIPSRLTRDVDLVAYDTTDDGAINYDRLVVETSDGETDLTVTPWFRITSTVEDGTYGSWSKLLRADPNLTKVSVYWGQILRNNVYPEEYRRLIEAELGPWPGTADELHAGRTLVGRDGIDARTFIEQSDRLSAFLTRATQIAIEKMPFELLLSYQPVIDNATHQFLLTSDRQERATPENRAIGEMVRRSTYAAFDRAVRTLRDSLDLSRDALIVTGDHGVAPYDVDVRINPLLPSHWRGVANGNIVHLYRFDGPDDTDDVMRLLRDLKAPDGDAVFELVTKKAADAHPNSGDIVAFAWPRFNLNNGAGETFTESVVYGQHGGLARHHEFDTTLGAIGAGLPSQRIESLDQREIAPLVVRLLDLPAE